MNILLIKTDQEEASLFLYRDQKLVQQLNWLAGRQLAETIHLKIKSLLDSVDMTFEQLEGVGVFSGPGSFTGLRIGHSVANALAYGLGLPIVGTRGLKWQKIAVERLIKDQTDEIVMPYYGAPPRLTSPRK